MGPLKTNEAVPGSSVPSKDKSSFFSFNSDNAGSAPFFPPKPSLNSTSDVTIQRAPETGDATSTAMTDEELDVEIKRDELLEELPGVDEVIPPELLEEITYFFMQYDEEVARRSQLKLLPEAYVQKVAWSNNEMAEFAYKLKEQMYSGEVGNIEDALDCCYRRLDLFMTETDLFEKVMGLGLLGLGFLFSQAMMQALSNLKARFKELEVTVDALKKALAKAEKDVTGAKIDMAIGVLLDGIVWGLAVTNPWVALGIQVGKFALSRAADNHFGPDVEGFLNDVEPINDAAGGAVDFLVPHGDKIKNFSPGMKGALGKLGKGSLVIGGILDINEIAVAMQKSGDVAKLLADVNIKLNNIAQLYALLGGEKSIERLRVVSRAILANISKSKSEIIRLDGELEAGFTQFYNECL